MEESLMQQIYSLGFKKFFGPSLSFAIVIFLVFGCASTSDKLRNALRRGDLHGVRNLIKSGAKVNTLIDGHWPALTLAVFNGQTEIVRSLVKAGADVNAKFAFGETALLIASAKCHTKIVRILIDAGANVNAMDKLGRTALIEEL
ncbi:MAG TPA: hypothetical protein DDZ83_10035 [Nitrospinae bacterium]|nr:hypothetical protein [Nitrospinota bacterium]